MSEPWVPRENLSLEAGSALLESLAGEFAHWVKVYLVFGFVDSLFYIWDSGFGYSSRLNSA